ncbi:MAG: hypothetical protein KC503_16660 [Myxococcales bacterium]|nr:hypothetical protein [Myxococcales bacterium]
MILLCMAPCSRALAFDAPDPQIKLAPTRQASRRGLVLTGMGGQHMGWGDTRVEGLRHNPLAGGILGYESPFSDSQLTGTWQLMIFGEIAKEGEWGGFGAILGSYRLTYWIEPIGLGGLGIWTSLGIGIAGYQHIGAAFNVQVGADLMFTSFVGIGAFVDFTAISPSPGDNLVTNDSFDGAVTLSSGGRLIIKIPF